MSEEVNVIQWFMIAKHPLATPRAPNAMLFLTPSCAPNMSDGKAIMLSPSHALVSIVLIRWIQTCGLEIKH
jgi:hypothetical protein